MTPDQIDQYALEIASQAVAKAAKYVDRWLTPDDLADGIADEDRDALEEVLEIIAENITGVLGSELTDADPPDRGWQRAEDRAAVRAATVQAVTSRG